jgi:hypothetical protein
MAIQTEGRRLTLRASLRPQLDLCLGAGCERQVVPWHIVTAGRHTGEGRYSAKNSYMAIIGEWSASRFGRLTLGDLLLPMRLGRPRTGQDKLKNKTLVHLAEIEPRALGCAASP